MAMIDLLDAGCNRRSIYKNTVSTKHGKANTIKLGSPVVCFTGPSKLTQIHIHKRINDWLGEWIIFFLFWTHRFRNLWEKNVNTAGFLFFFFPQTFNSLRSLGRDIIDSCPLPWMSIYVNDWLFCSWHLQQWLRPYQLVSIALHRHCHW